MRASQLRSPTPPVVITRPCVSQVMQVCRPMLPTSQAKEIAPIEVKIERCGPAGHAASHACTSLAVSSFVCVKKDEPTLGHLERPIDARHAGSRSSPGRSELSLQLRRVMVEAGV